MRARHHGDEVDDEKDDDPSCGWQFRQVQRAVRHEDGRNLKRDAHRPQHGSADAEGQRVARSLGMHLVAQSLRCSCAGASVLRFLDGLSGLRIDEAAFFRLLLLGCDVVVFAFLSLCGHRCAAPFLS